MSDIALNAAGDLDLTGNKLHLVYDGDYRAQRMSIALRHRMGEYFRDQSAGTDYDGAIWSKSTELTRRAEVRRRVLQIPGIQEIVTMSTNLDRQTRRWSADIVCVQDDGTVLEQRFTGRT